jgi:hypothetical protein
MSLVVRGLIPVGLMPSAEHPFTLELCPEFFPAPASRHVVGMDMAHGVLDHAMSQRQSESGHAGRHSHGSRVEHCPFAASALAAPAPAVVQLTLPLAIAVRDQTEAPVPIRAVQRLRGHQARAPPSSLI